MPSLNVFYVFLAQPYNIQCKRVFCVVFCNKCVHDSGNVLQFEDVNSGAVSLSRSGPQHDQRRLRFLYVCSSAII